MLVKNINSILLNIYNKIMKNTFKGPLSNSMLKIL